MAALESIPTIPRVNPDDYEVLRPDSYHTRITSQEVLLEKYLRLLSDLIEKAAGNEDQPGYDQIVFLDKSARPLAWMMRDFWPHMAPQHIDEDTGAVELVPMPKISYVNIDRLNWRNNPLKEMDDAGAKTITSEDIKGLRSIFQNPRLRDENDDTTFLDGKRVLIVDEQSESGDTLKIASKLFKEAFPKAIVGSTAWINHPKDKVVEIPMWYPPRDSSGEHFKETGRGIFDPVEFDPKNPYHNASILPESYKFLGTLARVPKKQLTEEEQLQLAGLLKVTESSESPAERHSAEQRIKRLSTEADPESLQLRKEVGKMLIDFTQGRLFPAITTERIEILGRPAAEYGQQARKVREARI